MPSAPEHIEISLADSAKPAQSISGMTLNADTGVAGDFITSTAAQRITATLSAELATASGAVSAESVQFSLNNGTTWCSAGVSVAGTAVSISGVTLLSGANTLSLRASFATTPMASPSPPPTAAGEATLSGSLSP
jgi:hypothetical protein